jgi:hypothetical protein
LPYFQKQCVGITGTAGRKINPCGYDDSEKEQNREDYDIPF